MALGMGIDIDRTLAKEEYDALTYNTRCWIRLHTEIVASVVFLVGFVLGYLCAPQWWG